MAKVLHCEATRYGVPRVYPTQTGPCVCPTAVQRHFVCLNIEHLRNVVKQMADAAGYVILVDEKMGKIFNLFAAPKDFNKYDPKYDNVGIQVFAEEADTDNIDVVFR